MLRLAPALTLVLVLGPIAAGLVGTCLPALDVLPALGHAGPSLSPLRELFATPGLWSSLRLTVVVGLCATLLSFLLAAGFCALACEHASIRRFEHALAPLLATPHVAIAIGFAFLIAPSGWIVRLLSPGVTGLERPPDLTTLRDAYGLSFIGGLVLKEAPYLVLMMIAASGQTPWRAMMAATRAMGYAAPTAWLKVVLPVIYPQIRLPIFAVLAFSLSVVEVGLVLAPSYPPPLSVLAMRWLTGYDLDRYGPAAAAAVLQLVLVVAAIGLWRLGEIALAAPGQRFATGGVRSGAAAILARGAGFAALASGAVSLAALAALALWAFAADWRFPDDLPAHFTLANWSRLGAIGGPLVTTLAIGAGAAAAAVALALACLENEARRSLRPGLGALWLIYAPLIVPQIAFLFGVQVLLVRLRLDATILAVMWAHLVFVLPYVFLSLADPYRALDPRYARIAAGLGVRPALVFLRVKLPLLMKPILIAAAIGFAVSVGLYLPTVFAGAGRVSTLTTEAVTLAAGADRRLVGATAFLQTALPLLAYALALALPALVFRGRKALR